MCAALSPLVSVTSFSCHSLSFSTLQDKAVLLEELQDSLAQLQEERATAVANRRRLDAQDESRLAHAAATAAMQASEEKCRQVKRSAGKCRQVQASEEKCRQV